MACDWRQEDCHEPCLPCPCPVAMSEIKWALFIYDARVPVAKYSGIRCQWQTDVLTGKQMWLAMIWLA